jgi:hypothetical protein
VLHLTAIPPIFLIAFFREQKFLFLRKSSFSTYSMSSVLVLCLKSLCLTQGHKDHLLLSPRSFMDLALALDPVWVKFCMWHELTVGMVFCQFCSGFVLVCMCVCQLFSILHWAAFDTTVGNGFPSAWTVLCSSCQTCCLDSWLYHPGSR